MAAIPVQIEYVSKGGNNCDKTRRAGGGGGGLGMGRGFSWLLYYCGSDQSSRSVPTLFTESATWSDKLKGMATW